MWSVRFEDVTKRYRKGGVVYTTFGSEFREIGRRVASRARGRKLEATGKRALDRVSFEIEEGESFALIGSNGAGKSTALRLLTRISPPSGGRVRGRGRVGALMEVGSGVHTELTGRENIWLYGSILGIPRAEIKRRFDEIVAFAELEGRDRHAGEVLLDRDEAEDRVLDCLPPGTRHLRGRRSAVGRRRSLPGEVRRADGPKLVREGTTVLFVSHDLASVESVCDRAILIDQGKEVTQGPVKDVSHVPRRVERRRIDFAADEDNNGTIRITAATCHDLDGSEKYRFGPNEGIEMRFRFECDREIERPHVSVRMTDGRPGAIIECSMLEDGEAPAKVGQRVGMPRCASNLSRCGHGCTRCGSRSRTNRRTGS